MPCPDWLMTDETDELTGPSIRRNSDARPTSGGIVYVVGQGSHPICAKSPEEGPVTRASTRRDPDAFRSPARVVKRQAPTPKGPDECAIETT